MQTWKHIAFCFDIEYLKGTLVASSSALHTMQDVAFHYVFVGDKDHADYAKRTLIRTLHWLADETGANIHIDFTTQELPANVSHDSRLSKAASARLLLPKLMDGKVLYMDSDAFLAKDSSKLFNMPTDNGICAMRDLFCIRYSKSIEHEDFFCGDAKWSYFNDGVMLLDLDELSNNGLFDEALQRLSSRTYRHGEQDALNDTMHCNGLQPSYMPAKYNYYASQNFGNTMTFGEELYSIQPEDAHIAHFIIGKNKPWNATADISNSLHTLWHSYADGLNA